MKRIWKVTHHWNFAPVTIGAILAFQFSIMAGFTYAAVLRVETITFWLNRFHEQWFEVVLGWMVIVAGTILLVNTLKQGGK